MRTLACTQGSRGHMPDESGLATAVLWPYLEPGSDADLAGRAVERCGTETHKPVRHEVKEDVRGHDDEEQR